MSYDYDIHANDIESKRACDSISGLKLESGNGSEILTITDNLGTSISAKPTWMTAFAIEPISLNDKSRFDFNITTKFKNETSCKGIAFAQTCKLHQGLVEYSIILKNSSISLRYPHWQNDSFLQDLSNDLLSTAASWNSVFMNLYKPVRFNYSRRYCKGEENHDYSRVYTNCLPYAVWGGEDDMNCTYEIDNSPMTFRDSMDFEIENAGKECGKTWRDPMQVKYFFPFSRSS